MHYSKRRCSLLLLLQCAALLQCLCQIRGVLSSEICRRYIQVDSLYVMQFVSCPDYCCESPSNGTRFCCSDCSKSVTGSACEPEQIWRYVLYIGLGIAGLVALGYFISYVVRHCREPMKRACCRERTSRVQDPGSVRVAMTAASAFANPAARPGAAHRRFGGRVSSSSSAASPDADFREPARTDSPTHDSTATTRRQQLRPPPPPAYAEVVVNGDGELPEQSPQPPPPTYSEAAAAVAAAAAAATAADEPPPPAYSEQPQQLQQEEEA